MKIILWFAFLVVLGFNLAQAESLTIYNDASDDSFLSHDETNPVDQKILWYSELQELDGTKIGMSAGTCVKVDINENFYCSLVLELDGKGIISATGVQQKEPQASVFVLTGGTDSWQGVMGKMIAVPIENRARFRFDIQYILP